LIRLAYTLAVQDGVGRSDVEVAWAEYELRRTTHFALELLLSALTDTLGYLTEGTVSQVVREWDTNESLPEILYTSLPFESLSFDGRLCDVDAALRDEGLVAYSPDVRAARDISPAPRALYGLALLLSAAKRTSELRRSGRIQNKEDRDCMEKAFSILAEMAERSVSDVMISLLVHTVVEPHLAATLRKMGQGQKCSLRFYPEGEMLRPTGTRVRAGYSGDRLGNVLGMWADLGELERRLDGRYLLTDRGANTLGELRA
jgi:hypothetical protein